MDNGAGTHGAGFEGHVKGGAGQAVIACMATSIAQCHDLGMGAGIPLTDGTVPALTDDLTFAHQHSAHGHLTVGFGTARQLQGAFHENFMRRRQSRLSLSRPVTLYTRFTNKSGRFFCHSLSACMGLTWPKARWGIW